MYMNGQLCPRVSAGHSDGVAQVHGPTRTSRKYLRHSKVPMDQFKTPLRYDGRFGERQRRDILPMSTLPHTVLAHMP